MSGNTVRLVSFLIIALIFIVAPAAAHEGREVGDYEIVFGWREEPAFAGMMNGPEVFLGLHGAAEGELFPGDVEVSLQAEVSFGDQSMTLNLRPAYGETGHYVAELVPTLPGDYSFRLTGTIGDVEVEEVFSSADGEFSTVEPSGDIMFPAVGAMDARIAALEARLAELEAALAELEGE